MAGAVRVVRGVKKAAEGPAFGPLPRGAHGPAAARWTATTRGAALVGRGGGGGGVGLGWDGGVGREWGE